ncbi:MAG TPA: PPOX class F420-dependent oxidoreductase [Microlunatus sp.]|nr:PPOX class F420-dependent oxidoreductase [Microlunatus sp.]
MALRYARATNQSVLTTIRSNGLPQLSNVLHAVDDDGVIRISTTADRAKYANLSRRPWAALKVDGETFWSYAVLEGDVELSDVATAPDDAATEELVALYRSLSGEHADWADYRRAMVADRRAVIRVRPTRAYGLGR